MNASDIVGAALIVGIAWAVFRPRPESEENQVCIERNQALRGAFHWPSEGDFDFEIVGEAHTQDVLAKLAGNHGEDGADARLIADLVPDDTNKFDSKAVAVYANGLLLGYLSKDDARSFRRRLATKGLSGKVTTCDACIIGGWTKSSGEKLLYGVRLDIKPFE